MSQALELYEKGWRPLPLPKGKKGPPPKGRTGRDGTDLTPKEIETTEWDGNLGTRCPIGVVGIDVDHYPPKWGMSHLERHLGCKLTRTYASSGREAPSGIYWYRVPARYGDLEGQPCKGVEIIQHHHRYAVVFPSRVKDEEYDRRYKWWDMDGREMDGPPSVDDLPQLPFHIVKQLAKGEADYDLDSDETKWTPGQPIPLGERDNTATAVIWRKAHEVDTLEELKRFVYEDLYECMDQDTDPMAVDVFLDKCERAWENVKRKQPDGELELGHMTKWGYEVLLGGEVVWHLGRYPDHTMNRKGWSNDTYRKVKEFVNSSIRMVKDPLVIIKPGEDYHIPPHLVIKKKGLEISLGAKGERTLLYGKTNKGKSWAALWAVKQSKAPTIYIATEQLDEMKQRIDELSVDNVWLVSQPAPYEMGELVALAEEVKAENIVLDVLSPMMGNENTAEEFHRVMDMLLPLTHDKRFLLVHHEGKDRERGARGSSRIMDAPERIYRIEGKYDYQRKTSTVEFRSWKHKGRGGEKGGRLEIIRTGDRVKIKAMPPEDKRQSREAEDEHLTEIVFSVANRFNETDVPKTRLLNLVQDIGAQSRRQAEQTLERWIDEFRVIRHTGDKNSLLYRKTT